MTYDDVIMNRLKEDGIYECVVDMFKAKQAEIERLRKVLRLIGESCPSHIIRSKDADVNALLAYNAGLNARIALGEEK